MVTADKIAGVVGTMAGGGSALGAPGSAVGGGVPFSGVLGNIMTQTATLDHEAQTAVTGLLNGSGVDVHQAMIATQRADMAFQLALEVRNKAVGAYQQMMGMQF